MRGVTAMAETKRMTAEQVVSYLLEEDGLDFLRESLTWVVQQLMESEVSELVGAARGERAERTTPRTKERSAFSPVGVLVLQSTNDIEFRVP
jgi:transposase-like protein